MVIPLMHYLQMQVRQRWIRWAFGGAIIVSIVAVVGAFSRGAFVAGTAVATVFLLKSRSRLILIPMMLVVGILGLPFVPQQYWKRIQAIENYQEYGSAMGRIEAWTYAYKLALDRPLTGGGFDAYLNEDLYFSYAPEASTARSFHSVYFEMLGDHGFVGLGIFLSILVPAYRCTSSIIKDARNREDLPWPRDLGSMLQVSLVRYAVAGLFQNLALYDLYDHLIALVVVPREHVRLSLEGPVAAELPQQRESLVRTGERTSHGTIAN